MLYLLTSFFSAPTQVKFNKYKIIGQSIQTLYLENFTLITKVSKLCYSKKYGICNFVLIKQNWPTRYKLVYRK